MREVFEIGRVVFFAFVAYCTLGSVGPAYSITLKQEAAKVYTE